jgi:hypothetical protein
MGWGIFRAMGLGASAYVIGVVSASVAGWPFERSA